MQPGALDVDAGGNIYIGTGTGSGDDYVAKLDPDGELVWGGDGDHFRVYSVAADPDSDDVYIGTESRSVSGTEERSRLRQINNGDIVDLHPYHGRPRDLVVGPSGDLFAGSRAGDRVYRVARPAYELEWTISTSDRANAVSVTLEEDVFVGTRDGELLRLDGDGREKWSLDFSDSAVRALDAAPGKFAAAGHGQ